MPSTNEVCNLQYLILSIALYSSHHGLHDFARNGSRKGWPNPAGPLPGEALSKLQNLTALRIHRNNFSGPVPAAIFEAPSLSYTNFEGNSELTGCIPVMPEDKETWHSLDVAIQGTKIAGLCQGQNSKDGQNGKKRTEL